MKEFPVVVADDDASITRLLEAHLTQAGHTVFTCADGSAALTLVQRHTPMILLADWEMPGITGPDLGRHIRGSEYGAEVYAILITGNSEPTEIAAGLDAGFNDYIVKPAHPTVLLARVRVGERVLRLRMQQRQYAQSLESEIAKRKQLEVRLQAAIDAAESASESLSRTVEDLESFNRLAVGRELRMIDLKQEVNALLAARGQAPKFEIVDEEMTV